MEKPKILNVFIAITISASGLLGQNSQRLPSDDLKGRQIRMDLHQVTTVNALTSALNAAHVPGGIITRTTCGAEERRDLTPLGPTLRDALDSIVVANPQYRWYLDKDAVNLVPSSDEPTLLDVVIAEGVFRQLLGLVRRSPFSVTPEHTAVLLMACKRTS